MYFLQFAPRRRGGPSARAQPARTVGTGQANGRARKSVHTTITLILRFLLLCHAVAAAAGIYVLEHPADPGIPYVSLWNTPELQELLAVTQGWLHIFLQCNNGSPFRKCTTVASNGPAWLRSLFVDLTGDLTCPHTTHESLIGKIPGESRRFRSARAATYASTLCCRFSQLALGGPGSVPETTASWPACVARGDSPLAPPFALQASCRPWAPAAGGQQALADSELEQWWAHPERLQLAERLIRLQWKTVLKLTCTDDAHINLKELRAVKLYCRRRARLSKHYPFGQRLLILVDSKVAVGAITRGRSPSPSINRVLRQLIPICLAGKLHITPLWIPSKLNPSDPPSRGRPLWTWLCELKGVLSRFQRA